MPTLLCPSCRATHECSSAVPTTYIHHHTQTPHERHAHSLLGNSHDEGINPSAPENRPARINQSAHARLIIVACHHEVHFRLRPRISSMTGEHDQLVQVGITLDIVRQRRHTQLQHTSAPFHRIDSRSSPLTFCTSFLSFARAKISSTMYRVHTTIRVM